MTIEDGAVFLNEGSQVAAFVVQCRSFDSGGQVPVE